MTTIYIVRHGEVENPHGIIYGRLPRFGLSKHGIEQIKQTAAFLQDKHIDVLYSSPLLRAKQTANIIRQETNLKKPIISKAILELRTSFQGKLQSSIGPSDVYISPDRHQSDESVEQMAKRMYRFIKTVAKNHVGKTIVMVSHGDPILALEAFLESRPMHVDSIRPAVYLHNGEVLAVTIDHDETHDVKHVFKPSI